MQEKLGQLPRHVASHFRDSFREARAAALRDGEQYQQILFVLERFGSYLTQRSGTLAKYKQEICDYSRCSPLALDIPAECSSWHRSIDTLYELVREARNEALHQGVQARHLTGHAIELSLIIEDALMGTLDRIGDFMVKNPVSASMWQPLSLIRQAMLENSFSYLPVSHDSGWYLVSDYALASYLRSAGNNKERTRRLRQSLKDAVADEPSLLLTARTVLALEPVDRVAGELGQQPTLVVRDQNGQELVGLVTAFDLL